MTALGFDTSNYTTSCAWFDGTQYENSGKLLEVKPGELGLRQSNALFQHVKQLPDILDKLDIPGTISAVGASTRPRAVEGSYMPCFIAGESYAKVLAKTLGVHFYAFSHQQGHLAAVLLSAGCMELMDKTFLAWHLSGGTTELLLVYPKLEAVRIGGTVDLSAGQLIDRTGQILGLDFPAGKALDQLAGDTVIKPFSVKVSDMFFSLSGMQNKTENVYHTSKSKEETAAFALGCITYAVKKATLQALQKYGDLPVVFTGGVASNSQLRSAFKPMNAVFGSVQYSTDNALGISVLTYFAENSNG